MFISLYTGYDDIGFLVWTIIQIKMFETNKNRTTTREHFSPLNVNFAYTKF